MGVARVAYCLRGPLEGTPGTRHSSSRQPQQTVAAPCLLLVRLWYPRPILLLINAVDNNQRHTPTHMLAYHLSCQHHARAHALP